MKWGQDAVGVVLTRNEIWLLLHALTAGPKPALGWDGRDLEPWVIGELQRRLREALNPEPVKDVEIRPVIRLDSEMGQNLVLEDISPLVTADAFDLGTLFHACSQRGWGAEVVLPPGAIGSTPATATVRVKRDDGAGVETEESYIGVERPVIALARALIAALVSAPAEEPATPASLPDD
jgi:hypothetical protein